MAGSTQLEEKESKRLGDLAMQDGVADDRACGVRGKEINVVHMHDSSSTSCLVDVNVAGARLFQDWRTSKDSRKQANPLTHFQRSFRYPASLANYSNTTKPTNRTDSLVGSMQCLQ